MIMSARRSGTKWWGDMNALDGHRWTLPVTRAVDADGFCTCANPRCYGKPGCLVWYPGRWLEFSAAYGSKNPEAN